MVEDVSDGCDGAPVDWGIAKVIQRVGKGVRLELETDLDDVQRGYGEAGKNTTSQCGSLGEQAKGGEVGKGRDEPRDETGDSTGRDDL